jgi:hypothetical protein
VTALTEGRKEKFAQKEAKETKVLGTEFTHRGGLNDRRRVRLTGKINLLTTDFWQLPVPCGSCRFRYPLALCQARTLKADPDPLCFLRYLLFKSYFLRLRVSAKLVEHLAHKRKISPNDHLEANPSPALLPLLPSVQVFFLRLW